MVKGVIFDCDGVLLDSEVTFLTSLVKQLAKYGKTAVLNDVKHVVGQVQRDIATQVKNQFDLPQSVEQIMADVAVTYEENKDYPNMKPNDGLVELIDLCKSKGIRMAVASSSSNDYLDKVLHAIGVYDDMDFILSGEDFTKSKPDPEIYNVAATKMGIDKSELIIIEDSVNGIKSAVASGIYTYGYKGSEIWQNTSQADKEITHFNQIEL